MKTERCRWRKLQGEVARATDLALRDQGDNTQWECLETRPALVGAQLKRKELEPGEGDGNTLR